MASSVPLAERSDIHKSCKSMETLVNVLNDYCEVSGTLATLEKKLAKAMKEAAGLKAMTEVPANAFNASATIFEALADINSKFSKLADKEYDFISTEVKKWFKKLAKEEKAHNEKIANADAKIKQAGQAYEKKAKKNPREAQEEHARYVGLLTTLGPEITQEKYNHAVAVTERHTTTTYHLAGCLSRLADAEWVRVCEGVRRFSPSVGQLGECRALCEGGWIGTLPQGLPDPDQNLHSEQVDLPRQVQQSRANTQLDRGLHPGQGTAYLQAHSPLQSRAPTPSSDRHSVDYPRPLSENFTDSVKTLSAFPAPPNHYPLPPSNPRIPEKSQSHQSIASITQAFTDGARLTDSPLPQGPSDSPQSSRTIETKPAEPHPVDSKRADTLPPTTEQKTGVEKSDEQPTTKSEDTAVLPPPTSDQVTPPQPSRPPLPPTPSAATSKPQEEQVNGNTSTKTGGSQDKVTDDPKTKAVERTDTGGSTNSVVAQLRNKYSNVSRTASPPPKNVPKLPLSVTDLASRYESVDAPGSPRLKSTPSVSRHLSTRQSEHTQHKQGSLSVSSITPTPEDESFRRRRQQAEFEWKERDRELKTREEEITRQAKELERERAKLNSTREQQQHAEPTQNRTHGERRLPQMPQDSGHSVSPVSIRPSHHSQYSYGSNANPHLVPPSPSSSGPPQFSQPQRSPTTSQHRTPHQRPPSPYRSNSPRPFPGLSHAHSNSSLSQSHAQGQQPHHASCACEACSLARYRASISSPGPSTSPTSYNFNGMDKPMVTLRPEKPSKGGWMRRLSMPVVGFSGSLTSGSGDKKDKGISNVGISSKVLFAMDGKKNVSLTALKNGLNVGGSHGGAYALGSGIGSGILSGSNSSAGGLSVGSGPGTREDGRYGQELPRRSYDSSNSYVPNNNRSVTNLGLRR
ncbi:hypothetical protein AX16_002712 [Volvariella volvacea WC 439]|nr:hypothetical protein AX16_002712 [Volvariella volvacea WC 439]